MIINVWKGLIDEKFEKIACTRTTQRCGIGRYTNKCYYVSLYAICYHYALLHIIPIITCYYTSLHAIWPHLELNYSIF